jgi:Uncharacterized conserved protein CG6151-P
MYRHKTWELTASFCRLGVLSMILCLALGIANIFTFNIVIIVFCALCLYVSQIHPSTSFHHEADLLGVRASAFIILFIEIPLLLRICPTSSTFDASIRRISTNYMRAGAYAIMAVIQFLSTIPERTSLIAAGVLLSLTAICYLLAAIKGQAFVGSKTLGGQGVAQMIV